MLKEFKDFMMRGNIIAFAIGIAMGAAFTKLVDIVISNFVSPIIGSLSTDGIAGVGRIHLRGANYISIGNILEGVIVFIATAMAIFFLIVKPLKKMGFNPGDGK